MLFYCDCRRSNLTSGFFIFLFMVTGREIIFICSAFHVYVFWNQLYLNIVTTHYVPRTSGNWPLCHVTNFREFEQTVYEIMILCHVYLNSLDQEFSLKLKYFNKVFVQTFRYAVALWKSWVCNYSIRFQVIKLKLLCETLKNEQWKFLAWYPNKMWQYCQRKTKCGNLCWTNFQVQVALMF